MHRAIRTVLILCFALATVAAFAQQDFSADMVDTSPGKQGVTKAKVYATKDKMRFEYPEAQGGRGAAVITNFSTHTSSALMPDRKMYMEFSQGQTPGSQQWSRELFRLSDAGNACDEWLKMQWNRGGTCKNLGSDTVNGRSAIKYEGTRANGDTGYVWVDKKIGFPIKWQGKNGQGELQNIKEGSQPASLFDIPSDYQKFQMPAGMQNMQRPQ
ncbi:MAG TPA: hypothetical protein VEI26_14730 [Terriglobales bacterium]|nr:hypothetical protein [Terriglobales bacterium]